MVHAVRQQPERAPLVLQPVPLVRKINVDTDNRMAMTGAIRKVFQEDPSAFDPRAYLKPAREAMKQVCIARMTAFGQAGHGAELRGTLGATA